MKKAIATTCATLAALALAFALLLTSVRFVTFQHADYRGELINKQHREIALGMEEEEMMKVVDRIIEYLSGKTDDLNITAFINGADEPFFTQDELSHMADVRKLYDLSKTCMLIGYAAFVVLSILSLVVGGEDRWRQLFTGYLIGTIGALALLAVLGVAILVGFDAAFTQFHELFFEGNWQFDPSSSHMITMLTGDFFAAKGIRITILGCLSLLVVLIASLLGLTLDKLARQRREPLLSADEAPRMMGVQTPQPGAPQGQRMPGAPQPYPPQGIQGQPGMAPGQMTGQFPSQMQTGQMQPMGMQPQPARPGMPKERYSFDHVVNEMGLSDANDMEAAQQLYGNNLPPEFANGAWGQQTAQGQMRPGQPGAVPGAGGAVSGMPGGAQRPPFAQGGAPWTGGYPQQQPAQPFGPGAVPGQAGAGYPGAPQAAQAPFGQGGVYGQGPQNPGAVPSQVPAQQQNRGLPGSQTGTFPGGQAGAVPGQTGALRGQPTQVGQYGAMPGQPTAYSAPPAQPFPQGYPGQPMTGTPNSERDVGAVMDRWGAQAGPVPQHTVVKPQVGMRPGSPASPQAPPMPSQVSRPQQGMPNPGVPGGYPGTPAGGQGMPGGYPQQPGYPGAPQPGGPQSWNPNGQQPR